MAILALILTLLAGTASQGEPPRTPPAPPSCVPGDPCCPRALIGFCRVGCPAPPAVPINRPPPETTTAPQPTGVAVLELGVNIDGDVVSACVLHGVRPDVDRAAQKAAMESHWTPQRLYGQPVGAVLTVTFEFPSPVRWVGPPVTLRSALPMTREPITFIEPGAACPPAREGPAILGTIVDPPLLDYVEPAVPSTPGVSGVVVAEVLIGADGKVTRVKPLRAVTGLTDAVVDAAAQWRFARTCFSGQPIPLLKTITLRYGPDWNRAPR